MSERKLISIVIPVYNEARILESAVHGLCRSLEPLCDKFEFELILAENGSKDDTLAIGEALSRKIPSVSIFHHHEPDYGSALKEGIRRARGDFVICDEIDLCLPDFYREALAILDSTEEEMVIGSKAMRRSEDKRPIGRRFATFSLNFLLRILLGFKGTDTHGTKAFKRLPLLPVLDRCVVGKDIFATELVLRAERAGIRIKEVPIALEEKRPPSVPLSRRVPRALASIFYLFWIIRLRALKRD